MTLKKQEGILKNKKIAVIGLGYVGLPLAIKLSKIFNVVGYDISYSRINELKKNKTDKTNEVKRREILNSKFILFTNNFSRASNHGKLIAFGGAQRARREIMLVCHFSRRARLNSWDISPHFGLYNHLRKTHRRDPTQN